MFKTPRILLSMLAPCLIPAVSRKSPESVCGSALLANTEGARYSLWESQTARNLQIQQPLKISLLVTIAIFLLYFYFKYHHFLLVCLDTLPKLYSHFH